MNKQRLGSAFLILLILSGITEARINQTKLKALVKQMLDAQVQYDIKTLNEIYASDYVEISPLGESDSREKAIGFYKPEAAPNRDKIKRIVEADEFSIREYGKFAIVTARISASRTVEGQPPRPRLYFRTTFVCRKERGEWKIASVQYTGMRPPVA